MGLPSLRVDYLLFLVTTLVISVLPASFASPYMRQNVTIFSGSNNAAGAIAYSNEGTDRLLIGHKSNGQFYAIKAYNSGGSAGTLYASTEDTGYSYACN